MSKKLKDGVYKAQSGNDKIMYFVHDELIVMQWKYGTFKTTSNFMLGAKWIEPLPMTTGEFMKGYNQVEQW
tara:strand:+ start:557 stop:769 length:213 start_codon:yes stop_codon:yes gene_type:complete